VCSDLGHWCWQTTSTPRRSNCTLRQPPATEASAGFGTSPRPQRERADMSFIPAATLHDPPPINHTAWRWPLVPQNRYVQREGGPPYSMSCGILPTRLAAGGQFLAEPTLPSGVGNRQSNPGQPASSTLAVTPDGHCRAPTSVADGRHGFRLRNSNGLDRLFTAFGPGAMGTAQSPRTSLGNESESPFPTKHGQCINRASATTTNSTSTRLFAFESSQRHDPFHPSHPPDAWWGPDSNTGQRKSPPLPAHHR